MDIFDKTNHITSLRDIQINIYSMDLCLDIIFLRALVIL